MNTTEPRVAWKVVLPALILSACNPTPPTSSEGGEEGGSFERCSNAVEPHVDTCGNGDWDSGETCWKELPSVSLESWGYDFVPTIEAAQFTSDSNVDLLVNGAVLFGNGSGGFEDIRPTGRNPAAFDLDGDGARERAYATSLQPENEGSALVVSGDVPGTSSEVVHEDEFQNWALIAGGDFTGDGLDDLILVHRQTVGPDEPRTHWAKALPGKKLEVFANASERLSGNGTRPGVGDVNNDGIDDFLTLAALFFGSPDGPKEGPPLPRENADRGSPRGTASLGVDLNCDERGDVVSPIFSSADLPENVQGGYGAWLQSEEGLVQLDPVSGETKYDQVQVAELNGDGVPDLILQGVEESGVWLAYGRGDGTFTPAVAAPPGWITATAADVDGDEHTDLIGITRTGDSTARIDVLVARP